MLQNLQDLWTHRVLKSLLVPKPNVRTFFHNFSVTQQGCTRPWIYMVLVAARTLRGIERDRQLLLLHHVQVSEIVAHGTHSRVGNNHAQQQNRANRNENLTLYRYHSARHCKCRHCEENADGNRPKKDWPDDQGLFLRLPALQEGGQFEQTPQSLRPCWVPKN